MNWSGHNVIRIAIVIMSVLATLRLNAENDFYGTQIRLWSAVSSSNYAAYSHSHFRDPYYSGYHTAGTNAPWIYIFDFGGFGEPTNVLIRFPSGYDSFEKWTVYGTTSLYVNAESPWMPVGTYTHLGYRTAITQALGFVSNSTGMKIVVDTTTDGRTNTVRDPDIGRIEIHGAYRPDFTIGGISGGNPVCRIELTSICQHLYRLSVNTNGLTSNLWASVAEKVATNNPIVFDVTNGARSAFYRVERVIE